MRLRGHTLSYSATAGSGAGAATRRRSGCCSNAGPDVNANGCFRAQPRGQAYIHGYEQQVRLLRRGDEMPADGENDVDGFAGGNLLRSPGACPVLLERGADVNAEWGAVGVLKVAISKSHLDIVK